MEPSGSMGDRGGVEGRLSDWSLVGVDLEAFSFRLKRELIIDGIVKCAV